ncbi:MAG: hypothetical protein IJP04_09020, partial [Clostridia bacterium]|nr:hypothetical protein [Clostridia bacterium]
AKTLKKRPVPYIGTDPGSAVPPKLAKYASPALHPLSGMKRRFFNRRLQSDPAMRRLPGFHHAPALWEAVMRARLFQRPYKGYYNRYAGICKERKTRFSADFPR